MASPETKEKKVSYSLLPYSKLRPSLPTFVPEMLSRKYFEGGTTPPSDLPLPFLINLSPLEDSETTESPRKILPHQYLLYNLEFYNFFEASTSAIYEIRIEIEYLSTFPGVEKYLGGETEESKELIEETETLYVRK